MLLAKFYHNSPSGLSVGDKRKALEHAKLAVQYGPGYSINHLALAEIYLDRKQRDAAVAALQTILGLTPPADYEPETRSEQERARRMLTELGVEAPAAAQASCEAPGGVCVNSSE
jgi:hypothetical protein